MQAVMPNASAADPAKHVKYNLGMVLGVDDFTQEFTYHTAHREWLARDALGYGTLWGLKVLPEDTSDKGPRILIECGAALSPRGQLIHVSPAQCAFLNDWLAANRDAVTQKLGGPPSPGNPAVLYAVLAYGDCDTDDVPLAGEPCRTEDQLTAPSRTKDYFRLQLRLDPPPQTEEDALRNFVRALAQVQIATSSPMTSLEDFEDAVRNSPIPVVSSPPGSPPVSEAGGFDYAFPPTIAIPGDQVAEYLRAAFRIWTVELRPRCRPEWLASGGTCLAGATAVSYPPTEEFILLARLTVPITVDGITGKWSVTSAGDVDVDDRDRPYVLHLRMLQEWMVAGAQRLAAEATSETLGMTTAYRAVAAGAIEGDGTPIGPVLNHLRGVTVAGVTDVNGQKVFTFDGYGEPDGTFQYVVNALATHPTPTTVISVRFLGFHAQGVVLRITRGATALTPPLLDQVKLMLEINRIG